MSTINRRRFAGLSLAAATTMAVSSARAQSATPNATPADGWTYTDLQGKTVTLPAPPTRIAANMVTAAALWDLGIKVVAVFDWTATAYPDGDHIAWGSIDVSQIEIISDESGYIIPEMLVAADVDIVLTQTFLLGDPDQLNGVPAKTAATIEAIAPVLVITDMEPADVQVERIVAIAESFGADLSAPEIVAAKDAFEAKLEEFRAVAAVKTDLVTLFMNASAAELYIAGPGGVNDLAFLASLGLRFANEDAAAAGDYWESLSAEQALLYPADVLFMDVYSTLLTAEDLAAEPAYAQMPAVQAGQMGLWERDYPQSYAGVTRFLETLLTTLRTAEKVV